MNSSPCILCGRPTKDRALYLPNEPARFGLPPPPAGEVAVLVHSLCRRHFRPRRSVMLIIEDELLRRANRGEVRIRPCTAGDRSSPSGDQR